MKRAFDDNHAFCHSERSEAQSRNLFKIFLSALSAVKK